MNKIISAETKICCVMGEPVAHSLSPIVHNCGYEVLGLDFVYIAFSVNNIRLAMDAVRTLGIRGASITIPHKINAVKYIDEMDNAAKDTGSINTVVNNSGQLSGFNTDYAAALKALEEKTALAGKRVILVGAGGTARSIAQGLKEKGARLTILNRTPGRAEELAKKVTAEGSGGLDELSAVASSDILINATPVGMWPDTNKSIVPGNLLHPYLTVFDVNYHPLETRLIADAREAGCTVVYGYKMFLYQAAMQFELFTDHPAPLPEMEATLTRALGGDEHDKINNGR